MHSFEQFLIFQLQIAHKLINQISHTSMKSSSNRSMPQRQLKYSTKLNHKCRCWSLRNQKYPIQIRNVRNKYEEQLERLEKVVRSGDSVSLKDRKDIEKKIEGQVGGLIEKLRKAINTNQEDQRLTQKRRAELNQTIKEWGMQKQMIEQQILKLKTQVRKLTEQINEQISKQDKNDIQMRVNLCTKKINQKQQTINELQQSLKKEKEQKNYRQQWLLQLRQKRLQLVAQLKQQEKIEGKQTNNKPTDPKIQK